MKWLHIYDIDNVHIAINLHNVNMILDEDVSAEKAVVVFCFSGCSPSAGEVMAITVILDTYIQIMEAIGGSTNS